MLAFIIYQDCTHNLPYEVGAIVTLFLQVKAPRLSHLLRVTELSGQETWKSNSGAETQPPCSSYLLANGMQCQYMHSIKAVDKTIFSLKASWPQFV